MDTETRKELTHLGKTDVSKPVIVGNRVFDSLLTTKEIVNFHKKQYHLLQLIRRGMSVADAAAHLDLEFEKADEFLKTPKALEYLNDRDLAKIVAQEAKDEDRWWVRVEGVLSGDVNFSKNQVEVLKEAGKHIRDEKLGSGTRIDIHIDPLAVRAALDKENAIEGQLSQ